MSTGKKQISFEDWLKRTAPKICNKCGSEMVLLEFGIRRPQHDEFHVANGIYACEGIKYWIMLGPICRLFPTKHDALSLVFRKYPDDVWRVDCSTALVATVAADACP